MYIFNTYLTETCIYCGGLNENASHRLRCLNTRLPVGGTL